MTTLLRAQWSEVHPTWTPLGVVQDAAQHHSGGSGPGDGDLVAFMRAMEFSEMNRGDGLIALAYHRVVISGGKWDGWVVESRPWDAMGGATLNHNGTSKAVMITGDFTNALPTPAALEAAANEWANAVRGGFIAADFHGYGHRDLSPTACPGNQLYAHLPTLWARVRELLNPVPTPPAVLPHFNPPLNIPHLVDVVACPTGGVWGLTEAGAVYAWGGAPYFGGVERLNENPPAGVKPGTWPAGLHASRITARRYGLLRKPGYTIQADNKALYTFPVGK